MSTSNGVAAACATILLYSALQKLYPTTRQKSWIITACSSATMTICSIPFVLDIVLARGDVAALRPRSYHAALACRWFQGFLLADLIVGCRYYKQHITTCWGWIHHSVYILLIQYMVKRQWAHGFCLCAAMELPTFHLALSFLHPRFRHDWLFCASFFATRIMFHLAVLFAFCLPTGVAVAGGSYLPAAFLTLAFPGHVVWLVQGVRGAIRRGKGHRHAPTTSRRAPTTSESKYQLDSSERTAFLDSTLVSATIASFDESGPWKHNRVVINHPM
ncbi:hypothetical protein C8R46DRAFT_1000015 [Mycena filopes]|nr:hypothetical protein C8R46DRAFT_1000015 [Mycena filopes]